MRRSTCSRGRSSIGRRPIGCASGRNAYSCYHARQLMLYQELPSIEATPLDGWGRWLAPALVGAGALTVAAVLLLVGYALLGGVTLVGGGRGGARTLRRAP